MKHRLKVRTAPVPEPEIIEDDKPAEEAAADVNMAEAPVVRYRFYNYVFFVFWSESWLVEEFIQLAMGLCEGLHC